VADLGQELCDRRCRLTIAVPVKTPGDFKNVTTEVIEIDGGVAQRRGAAGMRVAFKITKSRKKEPNSSEIAVTNLAPNTRSSLQQKGVRVLLEAGYRDTGVSRIFTGDVRTVDHVSEGPDVTTKLALGDGHRSWKYARVAESFAPGTPKAEVLRSLGRATGLDLGNLEEQARGIRGTLDQGFAVCGPTSRALDLFLASIGKEWSVQDGALQILNPYEHVELPGIPDITEGSGLIGSPEMGSPPEKGKPALIKIKSLLIPVKPGGRIKLKSRRYDGYVTIHACTFTGDTHGGDWYTEIMGVISK
jgi:hypothetical protein